MASNSIKNGESLGKEREARVRSSSIVDLFSDKHEVKSAMIQCTVHILVGLVMIVLYYNYLLIKPHFSAIFCAFLVSIPLHSLKTTIVDLLSLHLDASEKSDSLSITQILFSIASIFLEFLFGPFWNLVSYGPKWYFSCVQSISSETRVTGSKSSIPTSSKPSKPTPETQVVAEELKVEKLTQHVRRSINVSHSAIYFQYLFRSCFLYLAFHFFASTLLEHWFLFGCLLFTLANIHFLYHIFLLVYRAFVKKPVKKWKNKAFDVFDKVGFGIPKLVFGKLATSFRSGEHLVTELRQDLKLETRKQLHSLVTSLLLFSFLFVSFLVSGFLIFQFFRETQLFIDRSVVFMNETVISQPLFQEHGFNERFKTMADDTFHKGMDWADLQLKNKFPGYNITLSQLYEQARHTSFRLFSSDTQEVYPGEPHSVNSLFVESLPLTSAMLRDLFGRQFSSVLQISRLRAVGYEIKDKFLQFMQDSFHFDHEAVENGFVQIEHAFFNVGSGVLVHSGSVLNVLSIILFTILNFVFYSFNVLAQLLFFFATLRYLLLLEAGPLDQVNQLILFIDPKQLLKSSVEKAVSAVLLTTLNIFLFHALFTWLSFRCAQVEFVYISAVLSGFMAAVPIVAPIWCVVPAVIELYLRGSPFFALLLVLSHLAVGWVVDPAMYSDIPDSNSYVNGLSIVLGLWKFGWQGIVIGPLLACLPVIIFHVYSELLST